MSTPRILSIQVGQPRTYGVEGAANPLDRPWTTSFFKEPVAGPLRLGRTHLEGDAQADRRYHGGPDKAVMAYAAAHYPAWRAELALDEMGFGGFGENFTVEGQDESAVRVGDVYAVGTARVQVSQPRAPCWKIARRWRIRDLSARVQRTGRTGWYLRVLEEGVVEAGAPLELLDRTGDEWTIARINQVLHGHVRDPEVLRRMAAYPPLSDSIREWLLYRIEAMEDESLRLVGPNAE